ncbi:hypothetical protein C6Y45_09430 [Alkalicoccus saliphilus]|uniref:DUF3221 domain-containing protein n=2 Tax=Alkalicoccus saliphilus TaxID=200989 RepID=A0A2T4U614_9BACI|nr:hypothetical protein C6Y45_09430 [Alkalicoccus saliphilus]
MFMKYVWMIVLLLLAACSGGENEPPEITGYVTAVDGEEFFVTAEEAQDFSSTGGLEEYYTAIMFSGISEEVTPGVKVEVWADAVAESYPAQAGADAVHVLEPEQPEGAMDEFEAVRRALEETELEGNLAVADASFEEDVWTVELVEIMEGDRETVQVE